METQVLGAVGWISGFTDAFPKESVALWKLLSEGKYKEALENMAIGISIGLGSGVSLGVGCSLLLSKRKSC